jgi:5-methyltetrahydropteroyltriglutamate--homocysteine methyltransferase
MASRFNRVLATHVGSLVRPPALVEFLKKTETGQPVDQNAYLACLRDSVLEVVRQQAEAGVDIVSDGEFGKGVSWAFYVHKRLKGVEIRPMTEEEKKLPEMNIIVGRDRQAFPEFYAEYDPPGFTQRNTMATVIKGPVSYSGHAELKRDIDNLKAGLAKVKVVGGFLPVVAPASALPNVVNQHYRDEESLLFAIAEALRTEYRTIVDAGLYVQIDDAFLPYMHEKLVPPMTLAQYRKWARVRIDALNHALEGIPQEKSRYHICWGSWNGPHVFDVEMKHIVDLLLGVNVGHYSFEAANPRHEHEWRVWEKVKLPEGKVLIPGVISHATNIVEHPELVAERIVRLAGLVGRGNVMGGTDCGFAQSPFTRRVHPTIMWAKLRSLAEGAKIATRRLWGRSARSSAKRPAVR